MNRKTFFAALVVALLVLGLTSTAWAYATEDSILLDAQTQQQSNWCWAACASVVLDYEGLTVSQTTFATYVLGSPLNVPVALSSVKSGLAHWGVSSTLVYGTLTFDGIRSEINAYSRPVYARWTQAGVGHDVLVDGYSALSGNYVSYVDPADGDSYFTTYAWFVGGSGYDHTWTSSLKAIHD